MNNQMTTTNYLQLKGINYSESVTEKDLALLDGLFAPRNKQKAKQLQTAYYRSHEHFKKIIAKGDLSVNSLFYYQKVSGGSYYFLGELLNGNDSKILNQLTMLSDSIGLTSNIGTSNAQDTAIRQFSIAVEVFRITTGVESLEETSVEAFKQFIAPLRTEDNRWHPDLNPHVHKAVRCLALCLDKHLNCADCIKLVELQRRDTRHKTKDLFDNPKKHMKTWVDSFHEFLNAKNAFATGHFKDQFTKFRDFLELTYTSDFPSDPTFYFSKFRGDEFYNWLQDCNEKKAISSGVLISTLTTLVNFSNWYIGEYMSETDESGDLITVGYPILSSHKFTQAILEHGDEDNGGEIKPSESVKPAPPLWMILKLKEILTENDFAWPKSLSDQYNEDIVDEDGNPVWIPVITYVYLVMLEIPIRKIQVIRLDSGEGDQWRYNPETDMWVKNDHQLANYWKNIGAKVRDRGVLRRKLISGVLAPQFVFYINSNKVSDKEVGFSEKSGYEIPWKNATVIKYLDDLRDWQEKYNPVTSPVRFKDIPKTVFDAEPSEDVLARIPDRFYLFRSAKDIKNGNRQMPPTNRNLHEFWVKLMAELERRLHAEGVECQIILTRNKVNNAPQSALYTPHGLRVAGLTSLAQQGVPIEVLSKIVAGHKSILMTIYYVKYHPSHITEILNEASRDVELSYQKSFQNWLKEAAWDEVAKYAAYHSSEAIDSIKSNAARCMVGLWNSTNLGICPYNGTRCHDGGKCIRKDGKKDIHLPVEDKNCVVCRHFITGLPWLTELWVHANSLILQSEKKAAEIQVNEQEVQALKVEQLNLRKNGEEVPPQLVTKIKKAETIQERLATEEDKLFNELHATHNLIEKIKNLPKPPISGAQRDSSGNLPALLMDSDSDFEVDYTEAPNNFSNLDFVIQASRIYKHERNEDFERERDQFIDTILLRNGFEPMMLMHLTTEEKQQSADAFAKFLVTRFDGETLQLLKEGRKTFAELGIEQELLEAVPVRPKALQSIEIKALAN
ncbi:VPA1269 family protein [Vibrio parahaemolyticus]|uniref:VPA1269 family protein n=1 Tax=Vibrio parahaemolyticus TaxID=670 RepID=UPI00235E4554|nr:VPA1269 family protein [Vibrio parahaemolyticus]